MKKLLVFMGIFTLILPLMFLGCSDGDDGSQGAPGAPGAPGVPGPGALANETCNLCHAEGKIADTAAVHAENLPENQGTVDNTTIDTVTFGATVDNNFVPVTVEFTFQAFDASGADITSTIDLRTACGTNICARFSIAKLVAGTAEEGFSNHWEGYVMDNNAGGSSRFYERVAANLTGDPATGEYSYVFDNSVLLSDGYEDNAVHRVAIQLSGFPAGSFNPDTTVTRPVGNITADMVSEEATVTPFIDTPAGYPSKEVVTTAACNACHNPLAIHGGGRREIKFCQVCHNPKTETAAGGGHENADLVNLVHKIHTAQDLGEILDASEVTYPQSPLNCTTCHQGGADSNNYKEVPTIEACGACHGEEIFLPGGGHPGGAQANSAGCAGCHPPASIDDAMATENITPNNPQLPGTLSYFEYGIDSVTVDNTNAATIKFFIKQDNVLADLGDNTITRPTGFTGGPSFLLAYALPQDGVSAPVDYNNLGRTAGQPQSVSIIGLPIVASDNASYTVTVADAFPAGANMRAVALQGYFTQTSGGPGLDNVGRHTPSVITAVDGDTVRRTIVKSGYMGGQPVGCLECHEIFEGHGGNRVNNVQVCVTCHNPNLSSSGRTVEPADADPDVVAELGPDPLVWPEATNNMKEMIHGIHAATDRPYEFVRNSAPRVVGGSYYNWSEVTFPGNLANCEKCHLAGTYDADLPANILWTTEVTTEGTGTLDDILAARGSVPNLTDLVNSPVTSACYYCHDSGEEKSHFILQGGKLSIMREDALVLP